MKLYREDPSDIFDDYYTQNSPKENKNFNNKYGKKNVNHNEEYNDYDTDDFKEPASKLEYFVTYIKNRIKSYFYEYEEYYEGLKYILSKYKYLFRRFSKKRIINQTLSKRNNAYNKKDDLVKHKTQRKLEQRFNKITTSKNLEENLNQSYPYNNSDLYNRMRCSTIPDLKVYYYYYFCDNKKVSKEEYINRTSQGEICEFYNNTQKICFCPINYVYCRFRTRSKLKCMTKELIVNNKFDLTKNYDTFNDEHTKIPILDNDKKIFDFSLRLKCGMELDDSISGSDINFYLNNYNDKFADFDVISTEYHNTTDNGTQYTKEQIMNTSTKVLDYFIKRKNLVMFRNTSLLLNFSIIDQMWAVPFRKKVYEIKEDMIEGILSGEKSFNFTVDLNDLIENGEGEGPFKKDENKFEYPRFDKGDLHFFEIELIDLINEQIRFVPFRGEIKK